MSSSLEKTSSPIKVKSNKKSVKFVTDTSISIESLNATTTRSVRDNTNAPQLLHQPLYSERQGNATAFGSCLHCDKPINNLVWIDDKYCSKNCKANYEFKEKKIPPKDSASVTKVKKRLQSFVYDGLTRRSSEIVPHTISSPIEIVKVKNIKKPCVLNNSLSSSTGFDNLIKGYFNEQDKQRRGSS